jgi:hypothetical protein
MNVHYESPIILIFSCQLALYQWFSKTGWYYILVFAHILFNTISQKNVTTHFCWHIHFQKCPQSGHFDGPEGTGEWLLKAKMYLGTWGVFLSSIKYSEVPPGAQIHFGLQKSFPSTLWTLTIAIFGAFLKMYMSTKMGWYIVFWNGIE